MAGSGLWWLLPLIGLVLMGVMFFVCFRGFARAGRRQRTSGELSHLQHEVERAARAAAVQSFPRGLDDRHVQGDEGPGHVVGIKRLEKLRWRVTIDGRPLFTFCSEARARDAGRLEARRLDCAAAEARYLRGAQP